MEDIAATAHLLAEGGPLLILTWIAWQLRGLCEHMQQWELRVRLLHEHTYTDRGYNEPPTNERYHEGNTDPRRPAA